jgi:hypothetical protein
MVRLVWGSCQLRIAVNGFGERIPRIGPYEHIGNIDGKGLDSS